MTNYRQTAAENNGSTLRVLACLGYASTRQVARLVWGSCSDSHRKMAARTLRRLIEKGLVVVKRDSDNVNHEQLAALTVKGVKWINEQGGSSSAFPGGKTHARDYLHRAHAHRTACNSVYAASWHDYPAGCWSELEIRSGKSAIRDRQLEYVHEGKKTTKIPDLLFENEAGKLIWVEVENTYRSDEDLTKMIKAMRAMFQPNQRISEAHFVITSPAAKHIGKRLFKALTADRNATIDERFVRENDLKIRDQHVRIFVLDKESLELVPMLFTASEVVYPKLHL